LDPVVPAIEKLTLKQHLAKRAAIKERGAFVLIELWQDVGEVWRLHGYTCERVLLDRATTQDNLGIALGTLGERESGTARLEEAAVAYDAAAKIFIAASSHLQISTLLTKAGMSQFGCYVKCPRPGL
jgi:hypothetical protein